MKTQKVFFSLLFLVCIVPAFLLAQDICVYKMIGKSKTEVIKKYGSPVHQDNSNPDMMCMFYQSKTNRMIFVSNKEGVYQSEATTSFGTEVKARKVVDDFIAGSIIEGFTVDTVTINDFQLHRTGIKTDLQISENKITKNFDVSVKARVSED